MGNTSSKQKGPPPPRDTTVVVEAAAANNTIIDHDLSKVRRQVVTVLKTMKKSPHSARTQKKGLKKLRSYCNATPASLATAYAQAMFEYNGVAWILAAMRLCLRHSNNSSSSSSSSNTTNAKVLDHACRIWTILAKEEHDRVAAAAASSNNDNNNNNNSDETPPAPEAAAATPATTKTNNTEATTTEQTSNSKTTTTIVAVPLVLEAMKAHKRHANLQYNALNALTQWGVIGSDDKDFKKKQTNNTQETAATTSISPKAAVTIVEAGAFPIIWAIMLNPWHEFNPLVQDKALKALVVLTAPIENRSAFVTAQGWKALQTTAGKNFSHKPKLIIKALKICRHIAAEYPQVVLKRGYPLALDAMKQHLEDATLQRHGCSLMLALASANNNNNNTCNAAHAILWQPENGRDAVVRAMQQHPTEEEIQKTAILVLQRLPSQAPMVVGEGDTGTGTAPSSSRRMPFTTAAGAARAAKNNHNNIEHSLSTDTGDAVNSGIAAMVAKLTDPDTPPSTVVNICKAWIRLSSESHTNKLDIAGAKGVEAVVSAMARHDQERSLQRYGCQALTQLMSSVERTKHILAQANGIPVILQAIQQHTTTETHLVALHGIYALDRVLQLADNHDRVMACPTAIPTLVKAMETYTHHTSLQQVAMVIINKLASSRSRRHSNRRYKVHILRAGGLHAMLKAMAVHPTHKHIQRNGCLGLVALHFKKTSKAMVKAGALNAVAAAMRSNPLRIGIQMAALRTLIEFTQYSCHLRHWVVYVGGLPRLIASSQTHSNNSNLQELVFTVLLKASQHKNPLLRMHLVQAGGISTIVTCMQDHHPAHPIIQQTGFLALYQLSQNPRHGAIIFKHGGWKAVRQAQRVCMDDPIVKKYGNTLLVKLVVAFFLHWMMWVLYHVV